MGVHPRSEGLSSGGRSGRGPGPAPRRRRRTLLAALAALFFVFPPIGMT